MSLTATVPPPTAAADTTVVLSAEGVGKRYGDVQALADVNLALRHGHVVGLIGGNGAGKSTLMRIMAGAERPSAGRLALDGTPVRLASVRHAERAGIVMIPQELSLIDELTVADNVFLARERTRTVNRRAEEEATAALLARVAQTFSPRALVASLGVGQRQMVAIARALAASARILVMDEPTAALGAREAETLLAVMRELRARGVALLYVSHRLDELLRIADTITVLRDGRSVAEAPAAAVDERWIVSHMVGQPRGARAPVARGAAVGHELLRVESPSTPDTAPAALPLTVSAGEVVGLYGLVGAGRTRLLESVAGLRRARGRILLRGKPLVGDVARRIACGVVLVPEDRRAAGLIPQRSVAENLTLSSLQRCVHGFWLSRRREAEPVASMQREVALRPGDPGRPVATLSGGNQQKVLLGRALLTGADVLLLDEPTRGIDVAARAEIHAVVRKQAAQGKAVLVASSDADELLALADRIAVMARGRVVAIAAAATTDKAALVASAAGHDGGDHV